MLNATVVVDFEFYSTLSAKYKVIFYCKNRCYFADKLILKNPSAMGKQAVKTLVITDKKLRNKIMEMNRKIGGWDEGFDPFYGAPALFIVLSEKDWHNKVYDGSLVMGNLMLAAHSLGLGSIWIHRAKEEFESAEGKEILRQLGIEGEWEGIGHCAVGYMDGELPKPAPRKDGRVVWAE